MKKLIFTSMLCLFLYFHANCQTEKGKFLAGGTISGAYKQRPGVAANAEKIKFTNVSINPKAGYFIAKNLALGISIGYSTSHEKTSQIANQLTYEYKINYSTLYADPFVRYYFIRKGKIGLFAEGAAGIAYSGYSNTYTNSDPALSNVNSFKAHNNFFNYSLGLGGNYFIADKVALELNVNYQHFSYDQNDPIYFYKNNVNCSVGLMLFL